MAGCSPICQKSVLPEDPVCRCGYYWFSLPSTHPFTPACMLHDRFYDTHEWDGQPLTQKEADDRFLGFMLQIVEANGDDWLLKFWAYTMYSIVRTTGWMFW